MVSHEPRIKHVYQYPNGMVMVFDQFGQQMPAYQGRVEDVRDKINQVFAGRWQQSAWVKPNEVVP